MSESRLFLAADVLDDIERTRVANENRVRSLKQAGLGGTPQAAALTEIVVTFRQVEHAATLSLRRALRAHPLGDWVKGTVGVGEKQAGRLLAATGDPYWNTLYDRPRTVSELWAYCGLHVVPVGQICSDTRTTGAGGNLDVTSPVVNPQEESQAGDGLGHRRHDARFAGAGVAARRRKGVRDNWSSQAKVRAYLVALSCMKQRESPYRTVYEKRRAHTAVTRPEWTAGHSHNDALRVVAKRVLRDLWIAARDVHNASETVRAS